MNQRQRILLTQPFLYFQRKEQSLSHIFPRRSLGSKFVMIGSATTDAVRVAETIFPSLGNRLHVFAEHASDGWQALVGDKSWVELPSSQMSELVSLLCQAVKRQSHHKNVALLLSGGMDSLSVGFCLERAGKNIHAYTYHLEGYRSDDLEKAISLARQLKWKLEVITVPTSAVASDFVRLAVEQHCRRKTQFEVTFPLLYIFPLIKEREIWTGWNADTHYGNTKNYIFRQQRMRKEGWSAAKRKKEFHNQRRKDFNELYDPTSQETWWWGVRLAKSHGKNLLDPYIDEGVFNYFNQFTHEQLCPLNKPVIRRAFAEDLSRITRGSVTIGVQLQIGGGVDSSL